MLSLFRTLFPELQGQNSRERTSLGNALIYYKATYEPQDFYADSPFSKDRLSCAFEEIMLNITGP